MRIVRKLSVLVALIIVLLVATPVLASDVSHAKWIGSVIVTNNSSATTGVSTNISLNTPSMISQGLLNSSANDTALQYAGTDVAFAPGVNATSPWMLWVDTIGANSQKNYSLYTGNVTDGKIRHFGTTQTSDNASLEYGANFTQETSLYLDTSTAGKPVTQKDDAWYQWVSWPNQISAGISSNTSLDFELSNTDNVSIPDADNFTFNSAGQDLPFTITGWMKLESSAATGAIIAKSGSAISFEWYVTISAPNQLVLTVTNPDLSAYLQKISSDTYTDGVWGHFAVVYDGSENISGISLYVNNVYQSTTTNNTAGAYTGMTNTVSPVTLGCYLSANHFDGVLSDIKIYNWAFSSTEVANDYAGRTYIPTLTNFVAWYKLVDGSGNPVDSSGNGHNATTNLADWITTGGYGKQIVSASGVTSGDKTISINSTAPNPKWATGSVLTYAGTDAYNSTLNWRNADHTGTMVIWFKTTSAGVNNPLFATTNGTGIDNYIVFGVGTANTLNLRQKNGGTVNNIKGNTVVNDGNIHMATFVSSGAEYKLYADAILQTLTVDNGANNGNWLADTDNRTSLRLGRWLGMLSYAGTILDAFYYSDNKSLAEIQAIYAGYRNPTNLVAYWIGDDGSGTNLDDYVGGYDMTITGATWATSTYTSGYTGRWCDYILQINGSTRVGTNLKGVSVPNNASVWTDGMSSGYLQYVKRWVGGNLKQFVNWEYSGTSFSDQSGNANNAVPTFRTTSSDPDVSAVLATYTPVTESVMATTGYTVAFTETFASSANMASQMYTEGDYSKIPGANAANAFLDAGSIPRSLWWFPFLLFGIGILGFLLAGAAQSCLVQVIVYSALMGAVSIMGATPFWPAILIWIPGGAVTLSQRHSGWG